MLVRAAVRIDKALDTPGLVIEASEDIDLRSILIPGSRKTAFDVLVVLVDRAGLKSVLRALKEIQNGRQ